MGLTHSNHTYILPATTLVHILAIAPNEQARGITGVSLIILMAMSEIVRMNVGGYVYQTTLATLSGASGSLGHWFSEGSDSGLVPTLRDEEGRFFIDRDGKHFGKILNFLRDGTIPLPASREARQELRMEAEYFNLLPLIEMMDRHEVSLVKANEAASAAQADVISDAIDVLSTADSLCRMYSELGTTRQTELAVRLPAVQVSIQTAMLKILDSAIRSSSPSADAWL